MSINQNLWRALIPEEAKRLFSMVFGVSSRLFSEIENLLPVFFFFWVIEGVISCSGDLSSLGLILRGVIKDAGC
jgi:hypothetical protein